MLLAPEAVSHLYLLHLSHRRLTWTLFAAGTVQHVAVAQVKVLWVINAVEKNWEKDLPKDVRDALNASRKKRGGLYATEAGKADATQEAQDAKGELKQLLQL